MYGADAGIPRESALIDIVAVLVNSQSGLLCHIPYSARPSHLEKVVTTKPL